MMRWLPLLLMVACGRPSAIPTAGDSDVSGLVDTGDNVLPYQEPFVDMQSASECKDCHPRQYEEWRTSMHAYAAKARCSMPWP